MAKIVRFHRTGGPEVLKTEEVPSREPGKGEAKLRVQAIGLNRAESLFMHGHYLEPTQLPATLGYEAAGVVAGVGSVTQRRWRGRFLRPKSALFSLQADRRHHTGAISGLRKNHLKVKESRFRQDIGKELI
jgi:NADPH:quinone reductase-like Zn-dependent oxidoreductase